MVNLRFFLGKTEKSRNGRTGSCLWTDPQFKGWKIGLSLSGPQQALTLEKAIATGTFDAVQATFNLLEQSVGPALSSAKAAGMEVIVKESLLLREREKHININKRAGESHRSLTPILFLQKYAALLAESSIYTTNSRHGSHLYRDTFAEVLGSGVVGTLPTSVRDCPGTGWVAKFCLCVFFGSFLMGRETHKHNPPQNPGTIP